MKNFCRAILILVIVFFVASSDELPAQELKENTSQPAVRLGEIYGDFPSEELIADAYIYNEKYGGKFALRLCSTTDSLTTVYGLFSARLKLFAKALERTGKIPKEKVSYIFANNCNDKNGTSAVELWWIPQAGEEPEFVKRFEPCQLKLFSYGGNSDKGFKTDKQYVAALKSLAEKTRGVSDRSKLTGLVTATYYNRYPQKLRRRIETAKKMLAKEIKDGLVIVEVRKSIVPFISEKENARLKEKEYPIIYHIEFEENGCLEPKK